jgi:hypothetical protein
MKCQRAEVAEEITRKQEMAMTRRDYLTASGLALGGLVVSAAAGGTRSTMQPFRGRLSLNENPIGPSPLAIATAQSEFSNFSRYVDKRADVLTPAIVAHEQVSADQIVLGEVVTVFHADGGVVRTADQRGFSWDGAPG